MKRSALAFGLALALSGLLLGAGAASAQIKINEIRTDDAGNPDTDEYFELIGLPGASLAGLTYVVVGDSGSIATCGVIESIVPLDGWSLQPDGLLCLRNSNFTGTPVLTGYDGAVPMVMENSDNVTHMLVSGFTGTLLQDLDTNDDGVLDVTPWTAIVDGLGLDEGTTPNCAGDERLYGGTTIGPDGTFVPSHVFRYSDTQAWAMGIYNPRSFDTPGAANFSQYDPPPVYVDMTRSPCVPVVGQQAFIVALINDATGAELRYRVDGGPESVVPMQEQEPGSGYFSAAIPAQAVNGARVEYYCNAFNANPTPSRSLDQGYFAGTMTIAGLRVNDINGNNVYRYYGARVRGRVTSAYDVFSAAHTDFNLQDATGGINVFKFLPHQIHPALGDDITVVGTLEQYNGRLELSGGGACDTVLVTVHGPGTPPAPLALDLCDLREEHEGMLVRVQDLWINTYEHTAFAANWNYKTADCSADSLELFIDTDTDIPGNAIVTSHLDVVGIAGQYDTSSPYTWWYQVQPRAMSDITFLSQTSVLPEAVAGGRLWPCVPNPFLRTAEIRYEIPPGAAGDGMVPVRLTVYDLRGRAVATLVDGPVAPGEHTATIDRAALAAGSGIYFYRLQFAGRAITRKLVLLGR